MSEVRPKQEGKRQESAAFVEASEHIGGGENNGGLESHLVPAENPRPYQDTPRDDQALQLALPVVNIPEYVGGRQGHRFDDSEDMQYIEGVPLGTRQSIIGAFAIYRDPVTGEVYKSK